MAAITKNILNIGTSKWDAKVRGDNGFSETIDLKNSMFMLPSAADVRILTFCAVNNSWMMLV